jgi:hypothetical protein
MKIRRAINTSVQRSGGGAFGRLAVDALVTACLVHSAVLSTPTFAQDKAGAAVQASAASVSQTGWREEYAYSTGIQAYIYAFPLIYLSQLRYKWATDADSHPYAAPNHLYHFPNIADASYKDGGSPNNDTLYSWGFLDVSKEPVVISHPDMGNRYFTFELADMYADNFGYIGKRTTGTKAGAFLLVGPNWKGKTPVGIQGVIRSRTPGVLMFGRTFVAGPEDVGAVNKLQQQYTIVPLSLWHKADTPLPENRDVLKPFDESADPLADWKTINAAMDENPPPRKDAQLMRLFATVGIGPGQTARFEKLDEQTKRGLERAAIEGRRLVAAMTTQGVSAKLINGWLFPPPTFGRQGLTDEFGGRAACAKGGIICNDPAEAVYLAGFVDRSGQILDGANSYTLRFEKGGLPAVKQFWSITMYGPDYNLVSNPINRYAIRDRTPGIKTAGDGSVTLYLQSTSPGPEKESNWLPTPKEGRFSMLLRAYGPEEPILEQTWVPPTVSKTTP